MKRTRILARILAIAKILSRGSYCEDPIARILSWYMILSRGSCHAVSIERILLRSGPIVRILSLLSDCEYSIVRIRPWRSYRKDHIARILLRGSYRDDRSSLHLTTNVLQICMSLGDPEGPRHASNFTFLFTMMTKTLTCSKENMSNEYFFRRGATSLLRLTWMQA
jgi:hypothetical protein